MPNEWFCLVLGQELGPLSLADLVGMADNGELLPTDLVRDGPSGKWHAAGEVESLWPLDFSVCQNESSDGAPSGRRRRTLLAAAALTGLMIAGSSSWWLWPRAGEQVAVAPASAPNAPNTAPPVNPAPAPPPNPPAPIEPPQANDDAANDAPDEQADEAQPAMDDGQDDADGPEPAPAQQDAPAAEQAPAAVANDAPPAPMAANGEPERKHGGPDKPNDNAARPGIPEEVAAQEPADAVNAGGPALEARLAQLADIYKRRIALLIQREALRLDIKLAQDNLAQVDADLAGIATRSAFIVAQMNGAGGVIDTNLNQILQDELNSLAGRGTTLTAQKVALNNQLDAYAESMAGLMKQGEALRAEWLALVDPFGAFSRGDHERAIATFSEWIALDSENAGAFLARGFALWHLGRMDEAMSDFDAAVALGGPMAATSLAARGGARYAVGNQKGAMADFGRALKADKGECLIYLFRGRAYCAVEKFPLARNDFKAAAALNPKDAEVFKNWALLEAACPKPSFRNAKKALEHAKAANELTKGKDWSAVAALAAACAEAGDFEAAMKHARQAGRLAWGEHRDECLRQLALYEKNEPLRLDWKELVRPPAPIGADAPPALANAPAPAPNNGAKPLGFWLNTKDNVRHNAGCRWFHKTDEGRACGANEGKPCAKCGG